MIKSYRVFMESLINEEYKYSEAQALSVKKWLTKNGVAESEQDLMVDRFFKSYPKLTKKDIFQYKSLEDLNSALELAESFQTAKEKKKSLKTDVVKSNFGDRTVVLTPTPETSQFYGSETTWCTSAKSQVYHWLLHRIIGVEFYIISQVDKSDKLSVHINWDKAYSSVYDSENKVNFNGTTHQYHNILDLKAFINNDEMFNWILTEFEKVKNNAPTLVPNYIKKLCSDDSLDIMFNKYHYFLEIADFITKWEENCDEDSVADLYNNPELNSTEYEILNEKILSMFEDFKAWFMTKNYSDVIKILNRIKEKGFDSDDHIFIKEAFRSFIEPKINEILKEIPVVFDMDDGEFIDCLAEELGLEVDEIEDLADDIYDFYDKYDYETIKDLTPYDRHLKILSDFFKL